MRPTEACKWLVRFASMETRSCSIPAGNAGGMLQQRLHELLPWNWKKQQNMGTHPVSPTFLFR
jgi:hypothetical protein